MKIRCGEVAAGNGLVNRCLTKRTADKSKLTYTGVMDSLFYFWVPLAFLIWVSVAVLRRLNNIHATLKGIWSTLYQLEERIRTKDEEREHEERMEELRRNNEP